MSPIFLTISTVFEISSWLQKVLPNEFIAWQKLFLSLYLFLYFFLSLFSENKKLGNGSHLDRENPRDLQSNYKNYTLFFRKLPQQILHSFWNPCRTSDFFCKNCIFTCKLLYLTRRKITSIEPRCHTLGRGENLDLILPDQIPHTIQARVKFPTQERG